MRCLISAGPTWEPLDRVRRLTNFSTGSLGGELANHLALSGYDVTLLLSETATWDRPLAAVAVRRFSTTDSLRGEFQRESSPLAVAIFHAAAVSDFTGGQAYERNAVGELVPLAAGKLGTRSGSLLVELRPTAKLLPELPGWFPNASIVGWKYEVDGTREHALSAGRRQLTEARSHACVVNGPAHGPGFTLLQGTGAVADLPDRASLFTALERLAR
jgi:phosphopantothenoylcysteine synthetase/decarboxylase